MDDCASCADETKASKSSRCFSSFFPRSLHFVLPSSSPFSLSFGWLAAAGSEADHCAERKRLADSLTMAALLLLLSNARSREEV